MQNQARGLASQKRYFTFDHYLRQRFGARVWKIPVHAPFTCPNRDGRVGWGGCIYCNNAAFSPTLELARTTIADQIQQGVQRLQQQRRIDHFLVYFQSYSNTYAALDELKNYYDQAVQFDQVVGLVIGTRPDCISPEILDLLASYRARVDVWIEYGLQSSHDQTLAQLNRGHSVQDFLHAVEATRQRDLQICVHVILGLPGETRSQMLATARFLAGLPIQSIKIHPLQVHRDTQLATLFQSGKVPLLDFDAYISLGCDFLELLPPEMSIQRLTADAPREILIAPAWCQNKMAVLNAIDAELLRRDSWQGKYFSDAFTGSGFKAQD
ncbi:TIGR01212 family radical SAM protein [candidate division KSB1 bacterium]|nr:TIGR01212 family radical SAM protein [candidate division KSB1 bacterium]